MLLPDKQTRLALGPYLPNLAGYWSSRRGPVPQTGTMLDLSGRGNHGTCNGNAHAIPGEGMQFDGTGDYIDCGGVVHDLTNGRLTVAAWLLVNDTINNYTICGHRGNPSDSVGWAIGFAGAIAGDPLTLSLFSRWDQSSVASGITAGTWHHVAVTYDRAFVRFYVNGLPLSAHAKTESVIPATRNMYLGAFNNFGVATNSVNGGLDEVMIWKADLPAANIRALYETQRHLFGV